MESLKKLIDGIKGIGLMNALRAILYTSQKKKSDKIYLDLNNKQDIKLRIPGQISRVDIIQCGAKIKFQEEIELEIFFLDENLVRVSWKPGKLSYPYALSKNNWPEVEVEIAEEGDSWKVSSNLLTLKIHPCGSLSYYYDGKLVRHENPPRLEGTAWTQTSDLDPRAKIFGMGKQANTLNLRGNSFELWNTDPGGSYKRKEEPLYMPLPVYYCLSSGGGYLVFHENSFKGKISFKEETRINFMGGALRTYFTAGDIKDTIQKFTELTGRANLPPLWSLGLHQSRWGYKCEADIRRIAKGYQDNELPISAIHMDIDYMDEFRVFTIDPERFPDLKTLSVDMELMGIKLVTILDPAVKIDKNYSVFMEGLENDYFCKTTDGKTFRGLVWPGWSAFPDFTNPKTREWWMEKYSILLNEGIAGIWHDMNEPASFVSGGDPTLPFSVLHDFEGKKAEHFEAHNVYGMNMNRAGYEAMLKHSPEKRPWLLTRSGWVGVQRYAWHWTGDIESSWDALKMTVSGLLNLGISGISHSGSDIGGFSGKADTELFLRWFQLAAFTPFFRNHASGRTPDSEPWEYGPEAVEIIRDVLRVRERLLPYIYTCSWQASKTGYPLMRPMLWEDQTDEELIEIGDSYFFGDHLLITPVLEEGQIVRDIHFPISDWIDFYSGKVYVGGQRCSVNVTLDKIPVFVRSGAVIPTIEDGSRTLNLFASNKEISKVESFIFSDEGDGFGGRRIEKLIVESAGEILKINREAVGDHLLPEFSILKIIGWQAERIIIDGMDMKIDETVQFTSEFKEILIFKRT